MIKYGTKFERTKETHKYDLWSKQTVKGFKVNARDDKTVNECIGILVFMNVKKMTINTWTSLHIIILYQGSIPASRNNISQLVPTCHTVCIGA